ncbi:MAG: hypothetical protein ACFB2Z_12450 [Maricaulaceae bacterium]
MIDRVLALALGLSLLGCDAAAPTAIEIEPGPLATLPGPSACDLRFTHRGAFTQADAEDRFETMIADPGPCANRSTTRAEFAVLTDAGRFVLWEGPLFLYDDGPDAPAPSADDVRALYAEKSSPVLHAGAELPPHADLGLNGFEFGGQWAEVEPAFTKDAARWEALRSNDQPVACLVPETHYAQCWVWDAEAKAPALIFNLFW